MLCLGLQNMFVLAEHDATATSEGLSTTAIVLIGIGGLVAVFTVVMVLKRAAKKSKDKNKYNILESEEESDASSLFSTTTLNF